jgi:hypothetical protein
MLLRRFLGVSGVLLAMGVLSIIVPGCGSGQEVGPHGEVKAIPIVNPAPGALKPGQEEAPVPAK